MNFANDVQFIPAEYRASAKIVSGEISEKSQSALPNREPTWDHDITAGAFQ